MHLKILKMQDSFIDLLILNIIQLLFCPIGK